MTDIVSKIKYFISLVYHQGFYWGLALYFLRNDLPISKFENKFFNTLLKNTDFLNRTILKILWQTPISKLLTKVYAESTNDCNADCIMCRRRKMTRPVGTMDFDLFQRIADQSRALGIRQMRFHNFGEPLLDPRLGDKITYAKQIGIPSTALYTNGSLLTDENRQKLLTAGLDLLFISFDGATKATYEKIRRNLDYDIVHENIQNMVRARNLLNTKTPFIEISIVPMNSNFEEITAFRKKWMNLVDSVNISQLHDFAGQGNDKPTTSKLEKVIPCYMLWKSMFILWNGDVTICCMDFDGKNIIGNTREHNLKDIWESKRFHHLRLLNLNNRLSLCKNCHVNKIRHVGDQLSALKAWMSS